MEIFTIVAGNDLFYTFILEADVQCTHYLLSQIGKQCVKLINNLPIRLFSKYIPHEPECDTLKKYNGSNK